MAESAPGAAADWSAAAGGSTTQEFFDAASRGRRWRGSPTTTLSALAAQGSPQAEEYASLLAEVVSAACLLGEPTMRVIGNASVAAAAQLSAVPDRTTRPADAGSDDGAHRMDATQPIAAAVADDPEGRLDPLPNSASAASRSFSRSSTA